MTPDHPFVPALLADPDDDTLRLAAADWFADAGRPERAEFIAVQVELARGGLAVERARELRRRQRDLLVAHEGEWARPLAEVLGCRPGEWGGWVFRRGFVEYFHLPDAAVTRHGDRLAGLTPVRGLFLPDCTEYALIDLCSRPWVRSLTHLYLGWVRVTPAAARALVGCEYLAGLRELHLRPGSGRSDALRRLKRHFGPRLVEVW